MRGIPVAAILLKAFLCSAAVAEVGDSVDLILGHYEVHIDYELVGAGGNPDDGWTLSVSFDEDDDFNDAEGITRLDPATVRLIAAPTTQETIGSGFEQLGPVGEPLWRLPQSNKRGRLFLGLRAVIAPGIFQATVNGFTSPSQLGSFELEMIAVNGSGADLGGNFAVWESNPFGIPEFHFDSSDGFSGDLLESIPAGEHTHYSWAMTKPGVYDVTFRASGRLNPWHGGADTSREATFTFVVPFSGFAQGTGECRLNDSVELPAVLYHGGENCEYGPDRIALITESQSYETISAPYGFTVNFDSNTAVAASRVGVSDNGGMTLPPNSSLASSPVQLLATEGPGNLSLIPLSGSSVGFSFSESGIYRVTLQGQFRESLTNDLILGEPFTLVFLAGLDIDYDYAAWANSYERTHGKVAGSLSDAFADEDGDKIPNGIEFQLFWHGFDPCKPDADRLPQAQIKDGYAIIEYLRDTYKDDFDSPEFSIQAEHSPDLSEWTGWYTNSESSTLGLFETGAEPSQDLGRIMKRQLRTPGDPDTAFFRFGLD